ncbi:phage tail protein [Aeromonas caviae]|uniref:phage tail-collar fiber domain-containing protein n=1 Tax=Aeromonas caviae TaxID=648 RepID=UPI0015DC97E6|nr:phage tail protein [Aeromonas caviae]BBS18781.1 hypothetical protein WP5W18E02_38180 [Aeromonas caviae]
MSQVITNAFEQYWQSSLAAEQPVVLDEFILADIPNLDITAPIDPDTVLPPESQIVHRQNVDQRGRINSNAVAYSIVMDTTVGDFSFNAMFLRNKQNGVIGMIVYKGRETKLKTDQTTGQTGNSLVKSMLMGYDQAAEATLTNVDAGTWQIDYAARLRGQDEDLRQLASQLYGHHTFIGDGFKVVQQDGAHQVTPGVAIVGGLRVELKQPEVIYPGSKPIGVWVDVHRAGSLLSEHQNHFTIITSVADLADHVDESGYPHYVAKLGTVQADSTVTDGRGQGGSGGSGAIPDTFALWKRSMAEAGYRVVEGSFDQGGTLTSPTDVLLHEKTGSGYSGEGPFPQTVGKGTDPSVGGYISRGGELLCNQLSVNSISSLRDYTGNIKVVDVTSVRRTYFLAEGDNTSPDNGGSVIVDSRGRRWKIEKSAAIDITAWGVIPDGASDASVVLPYIQSLGAGQVLRLPYVAGTQNTYYFSTFDPNVTTAIQFIVDPGVIVSLPSDAIVGAPLSTHQVFDSSTNLIFRSLNGSSYVAGLELFKPIAPCEADTSTVSSIAPGIGFTPVKISWPNSDTFEEDSFAYTDQVSALFQYAPGDGKFHIGSVRPRVGDKYSMPLPVSGPSFPCVLVADQNGYSGVYFSETDASTCTIFRKNIGAPGSSVLSEYPMQRDHLSYSAIRSEIQLHVVSADRYEVLLNGFVVASIAAQGPIDFVGFGAFFQAVAGTLKVNLLYPTVIRDYEGIGSRFISVSIFGDSRSSDRMECWPDRIKRIGDMSSGLRLWNIDNHAIAGETSAQQLAKMQSVGVASANVVVIAVGTNDAQGQVGVNIYKANLEAMCDLAIAAGKPFIVIKPPLWYTQSQTGGKGQASANYQFAAQYRAICSLVCANKGGKLVDLDSDIGPIVAYYVNRSLAIDMVGAGDPVVFDNIHFTTAVNDITAIAVMKAIIGICAPTYKAGYAVDWLTVKALNSWLINTSDNPLQVTASKDGAVSITGRVFKSTGAIADGTSIAKIPQILAPRFYTEWMVRGDITGCRVSIDKDGVVKIYGMDTNNYVSLSGCAWSLP